MNFGIPITSTIESLAASGVRRIVALIRHSAREYRTDIHDLENPLTDEGRNLARALGGRLDPDWLYRSYSSPAERCIETSTCIMSGCLGERAPRTRPVEGLGVFYVLDQMRLFRVLQQEMEAGRHFIDQWLEQKVSPDVILPSAEVTTIILRMLIPRLQERDAGLDLCVSHDFTVYPLRYELFGMTRKRDGDAQYLDGFCLYEDDGVLMVASGKQREQVQW